MKRMSYLVFFIAGFFAVFASGQAGQHYVTGFNGSTLRGYSEQDAMTPEVEQKDPAKALPTWQATLSDGKKVDAYFKVVGNNDEEGLLLVEADSKRFWVEAVAVKVEPPLSAALDSCGEYAAVGGKAAVTEIGGTVGLGKKCK